MVYIMASQENLVKLVHKATGHTYWSRKNRKKLASVKLKLKKFNRSEERRVLFRSTQSCER